MQMRLFRTGCVSLGFSCPKETHQFAFQFLINCNRYTKIVVSALIYNPLSILGSNFKALPITISYLLFRKEKNRDFLRLHTSIYPIYI